MDWNDFDLNITEGPSDECIPRNESVELRRGSIDLETETYTGNFYLCFLGGKPWSIPWILTVLNLLERSLLLFVSYILV